MKKKSYAHGPGAVSLLGETIGENLLNTCKKILGREALVSVNQNYKTTYAQFWLRWKK